MKDVCHLSSPPWMTVLEELCYELIRPDVPEDNAVRDVADYLREKLPNCDVYEGAVRKTPYDVLCER